MAATVKQILTLVARQAPPDWAAPWDRVGLLVGSPQQQVTRMVVSLEASPTVVAKAVAAGAELVLSHHPLFLQPPSRFSPEDHLGRTLALALQHGVAIAAAHTNLDIAPGGLNDYLAHLLELQEIRPLTIETRDRWLKLAVFVPVGYEDRVRQAVCQAGAGVIGRYTHCSFASRGEGTYRPEPGAQPWRGTTHRLERAVESRLEVLLPASLTDSVLQALRTAHPYEEIAYDLYPLENPGQPLGFGRLGCWSPPRPWPEVILTIKTLFQVSRLRVCGNPPPLIERVAVCGGSGGDLIAQAYQQGAQLYLTGDLRYHQAVPWATAPLAVVDVGHYASEVIYLPHWRQRLREALAAAALAVTVLEDSWDTDPFSYY